MWLWAFPEAIYRNSTLLTSLIPFLHPTHMHTGSVDTTNAKQLINICPKLLPPTSSQAFVVVDLCSCRANNDREATEHNQPTSNFAYQAFLHLLSHWHYSYRVKVTWATGIILHSKYNTNNTHLGKWNHTSFVLFRERYSVVGESEPEPSLYTTHLCLSLA